MFGAVSRVLGAARLRFLFSSPWVLHPRLILSFLLICSPHISPFPLHLPTFSCLSFLPPLLPPPHSPLLFFLLPLLLALPRARLRPTLLKTRLTAHKTPPPLPRPPRRRHPPRTRRAPSPMAAFSLFPGWTSRTGCWLHVQPLPSIPSSGHAQCHAEGHARR
ncbi:hypothetical protein K438DRAFT_223018 [Mycena galopus ATCC 62051]|nr:hypothetical protein K438DRAFT_223018 [Mycena galopus ATCC 62051]